MKRLLWIADAGCPSGFARATHAILDYVRDEYDVTVLGINFRGDPDHGYPYPMYLAAVGGDSVGIGRIVAMCEKVKPDVIAIMNDPWFIPYYMQKLRAKTATGEYANPEVAAIPVVAALAVDGKNFRPEWLDGVALAVFWTKFARDEAKACGYHGPARVIPLGVDQDVYYPMDRQEALEALKIGMLKDMFIIGNVNRNQPRKRWDLTIQYFANWVHSRKIRNAQLFLHCAPTGDDGIDVIQMAKYYNIFHLIAFRQPEPFGGVSEDVMRYTYNCFDVQITTTQGEGFGLTTLEGMACGVPQIVPDWSGLGDWTKGAAMMVPCTTTAMNALAPSLNIIGGVPDERQFITALDTAYRDANHREAVGHLGLGRASLPCYRWKVIGDQWIDALDEATEPEPVAGSPSLREPEPQSAPTETKSAASAPESQPEEPSSVGSRG